MTEQQNFAWTPPTSQRAPQRILSDKDRLVAVVQTYMDSMAKAYGYDSIASAVTYAEEPAVPKFQNEGKAFRAWRSLVWARCYELLAEVEGGIRSVPDERTLIGLIPAFDAQQLQEQE